MSTITETPNTTTEPAPPPQPRLWAVTLEFKLVVLATSEREAEHEAAYYVREEEPELVSAREVNDAKDLPSGWHQAIPWGGDANDDRPCVERLQ